MARDDHDSPEPPGTPGEVDERFRRLFESNYGAVYRYFRRQVLSHEESEDLAHETFVRAYRGLLAFRGEASERTWLLKVATNVWHNQARLRRAKGRDTAVVPLAEISGVNAAEERSGREEEEQIGDRPGARDVSSQGPLALEVLAAQERRRLLWHAVRELPPQMRRCVSLRLVQELKYREIAAVMHVSIDTVKTLLYQAKLRLREKLRDFFDDVEISTADED